MEIDYMSAVSSMEVTSLKSLDTSLKEWRKEDDTGRLLRCHSKTTIPDFRRPKRWWTRFADLTLVSKWVQFSPSSTQLNIEQSLKILTFLDSFYLP